MAGDFAEDCAETGGIFSLRRADLGSDLEVGEGSAAAGEEANAGVADFGGLADLGDRAAAAVSGLVGAMADRVGSYAASAWIMRGTSSVGGYGSVVPVPGVSFYGTTLLDSRLRGVFLS